MKLFDDVVVVLERRGVPAETVRRIAEALARSSDRKRLEQTLQHKTADRPALLAEFEGVAWLDGDDVVIEVVATGSPFEVRRPLEGRTPVVTTTRTQVRPAQRLSEGAVTPGELLRILGADDAGRAIAATLHEVLALGADDVDALVAPMLSLVALARMFESGPKRDAPMLSLDAFDELVATTPPGERPPFVAHRIVAGYDVLAKHVDPPLEEIRALGRAE